MSAVRASSRRRATLLATSLCVALSAGCDLIPTSDGPVGDGEALVVNQSDAQLQVELGMSYIDDVGATVAAGETEVLTNLNGNFGLGPQICDETSSLTVTRVEDGAFVILDEMCNDESWRADLKGNYEVDFILTVTQEMVDAAFGARPEP